MNQFSSPKPAGDDVEEVDDNDYDIFEDENQSQPSSQKPTNPKPTINPKPTTNPPTQSHEEQKSSPINPFKQRQAKKFAKTITTKKKEQTAITVDSKLLFYGEGTKPIDGNDPFVYSTSIPYHPYSYLRSSAPFKITQEEKKFLPSAPAPTYMNESELYSLQFYTKEDIMCTYVTTKQGTLKYTDKETLQRQRGVLLEVIKKVAKSKFNSNMMGFSIPARTCEPRSMTDRATDVWRLSPYYLSRAGKLSDRLERLKLSCTQFIGSIPLCLRKMKSLNPVLGETCEGTLEDGTSISIEQTHHHPPITRFYTVGPNSCYTMSGKWDPMIKIRPNTLIIIPNTTATITFHDGHVIKQTEFPHIKSTGLITGKREMFFKKRLSFEDVSEGLKAVIFFDYGEQKGIIGSAKTVSKNAIEGIIYLPDPSFTHSKNYDPKRISELKDVQTEIAKFSGSWLDKVDINDVNYWNFSQYPPVKIYYSNNPIPSDFRFREDLIWLRRNKMKEAECWKDAIEIRQRNDGKERAKFHS